MPAGERKFKWCKHGHILGEVKTIKIGKYDVRALMLYEKSVELANIPAQLPSLRGRVFSMDGIQCTLCDATVDWIIGQDAFDALMANYPTQKEV